MIFLADENMSGPLIERLRLEGFTIDWVGDTDPGIDDDEVLQMAEHSDRILLTSDKDFGGLVFIEKLAHTGVVLLRLEGLSLERRVRLIGDLLRNRIREITGAFTVMKPDSVRITQFGEDSADSADSAEP